MIVRGIGFDYVKEHYTEEIFTIMLHEAEPRKTLLIVAPSGIGKTQAVAIYATAQAFKLSTARRQAKARKLPLPRAVYVSVPTHQLLREFAGKVTKAYLETASVLGRFVRPPKLILLKGSVYSCVEPSIREQFKEIVDYIKTETGLDYATGLQYRILLDRYEDLPPEDRERLEQELIEYSLYSELEMTLSYLCQTCPRNNTRANLQFLKYFAQSRRLNIVDTEDSLDIIVQELKSEGFRDVENLPFCPYRAFLRLYMYESELSREHSECVPKAYIYCMTHSMYSSIQITDILESRYRIVRSTGKYVRHIHILDEVDYILLSPPVVRLPIHVSPHVPNPVTVKHVEELARKYYSGTSSAVSAMKKLVEYSRGLYEHLIEIFNRLGGAVEGVVACEVAEVFARYIAERELPMWVIYSANHYLRQIRKNIAQRLAHGEVDVYDLVIYSILSRIVQFWWYVKDCELDKQSIDVIMRRVEYPLVYSDPRLHYYIELDHRQGMARVVYAGLAVKLVEHALKVALDPDYPYPTLAKIGLTATFSPSWISLGMPLLVNEKLVEEVSSKLKVFELFVPYRNVIFAKCYIWLTARDYKYALDLISRVPVVDEEDIKKLGEALAKIYEEGGTRKSFLLEPSDVYRGYYRSLEVLLNLLHELTYLCERYVKSENVKAIVFTGTRSQFDAFGLSARQASKDKLVVAHGVYIFRFGKFTMDKSRRDNFTIEVAVDNRGISYTLTFTYARSRFSRGVDLEDYDVAMIIAPPLKVPTTLAYAISRSSEDDILDYIDASATVQQCVFRIVRRLSYPRPKLLIFDLNILKRPYSDYLTTFLSTNIITSVSTPLADLVEGRVPTDTYC